MMAAGPESCTASAAVLSTGRRPGFLAALLLLSKPGIVLAETVAGFAGILLSCKGQMPTAATLCLTLLSLIMAASGAAMGNCLIEAAADRKMLRLAARSRALATAGSGPVAILALLLTGGAFIIAAICLNNLAFCLLAAASGSYLFLYTLWLKRCSAWGVLLGAIPGALPPLIGAAAVSGTITMLPLLLALIIFIWQLPHFWLLALEYRDQYTQAGFPVLPLTHGEPLTRILTLTAIALLLPLTVALGLLGAFSSIYQTLSGGAGIVFLLLCVRCLYWTHAYRQGFRASLVYLMTLFGVICLESLLS